MCSDDEAFHGQKNVQQSTVKWADIETGVPPQRHEIEALEIEEEEETLPLSLAQTKLEHLLEPSKSHVPEEESLLENCHTDSLEVDTLGAHAELIKMRDLLKAERNAINDQPNPFLPDGEVAKDAQQLVDKMKTKPSSENYSSLEYESLSIDSPLQSEDFASTDLNFEEDSSSPAKIQTVTNRMLAEPSKVEDSSAIINHGLIISAKTNTVERVVIPEKESKCCCIIL